MRILVVGAGMYVLGRGGESFGTVLPALAEYSRVHPVERVTVSATRQTGSAGTARATEEINAALGTDLTCGYQVFEDVLADPAGYDCAIVSVPDDLHFEVTKPLLQAGLHVQVVKPLTETVAQARELIQLAETARVHAVVEFHKRLDEQNLLVKRALQEGALGALAYGTVEYSQRIEVPTQRFSSWASRTNVFQYLGVHYVDLFFFLTGRRPVRAMAVGRKGILTDHGVDTYDSVHAIVVWRDEDGAGTEFVTQFAVGWIDAQRSSAMSDQEYMIVGARGRLQLDQKVRGVQLVTEDRGVVDENPYFSQVLPAPDGGQRFDGYGPRSVIQFVDDVRQLGEGTTTVEQLRPFRPTFAEALVSTAVVEAVNQSLAAGGVWRDVVL